VDGEDLGLFARVRGEDIESEQTAGETEEEKPHERVQNCPGNMA